MNKKTLTLPLGLIALVITLILVPHYYDRRAIRNLGSQDFNVAWRAISRLAARDPAVAIIALPKALVHNHQAIRIEAARVLVRLGEEGRDIVYKNCSARLDLPCNWDKAIAMNIIGELNFTEFIPTLIVIMGIPDTVGQDGVTRERCQGAAAEALAIMGAPAFVHLLTALDSDNVELRKYSVLTLKWMGEEASMARDKLHELRDDTDPQVRQYAEDALREIEVGRLR